MEVHIKLDITLDEIYHIK